MNKILVKISPFQLMQKIYIIKNGEIIQSLSTSNKQLPQTLEQVIKQYQIYNLVLSGAKAYSKGVGSKIKETLITKYQNITIDYI